MARQCSYLCHSFKLCALIVFLICGMLLGEEITDEDALQEADAALAEAGVDPEEETLPWKITFSKAPMTEIISKTHIASDARARSQNIIIQDLARKGKYEEALVQAEALGLDPVLANKVRGYLASPMTIPRVPILGFHESCMIENVGQYEEYFENAQLIADYFEEEEIKNYEAVFKRVPGDVWLVLNVDKLNGQFVKWVSFVQKHKARIGGFRLSDAAVNNYDIKDGYAEIGHELYFYYLTCKAMLPAAPVGLTVCLMADRSDERWLRAMPFEPDCVFVWNVYTFDANFQKIFKICSPWHETLIIGGMYGQTYRQILEDSKSERGARFDRYEAYINKIRVSEFKGSVYVLRKVR